MSACTAGGAQQYPYGDRYSPTACNGGDMGTELLPTGSMPGCEGGIAGVFDMSGNVAEWLSPCEGEGSSRDCPIRGGEFDARADILACESGPDVAMGGALQGSGFRCCLELAP